MLTFGKGPEGIAMRGTGECCGCSAVLKVTRGG